MDRLTAMRVFVRVAEHGGFAAAARSLGLSTSAVSRHVAELEAHLGTALLRRTTRRVGLTEAGTRYLPRAAALLDGIETLDAEIAALETTPRGTLRLSVPPGLGDALVAPVFAPFLARYPEIALELDITEREVDLVAEGYDAALRAGALPDSALIARRLPDIAFVACASPDYCARRGTPRRPEELAAHDCLPWHRRHAPQVWVFLDGDRRIELTVTGRYTSNSGETQAGAARAGLGVALLPPFAVRDDLAAGRLRRLLEGFAIEPLPFALVRPPGPPEPRRLRVFTDFLVATLAAPPTAAKAPRAP